jgi:hypothetical protein
VSSRGRTTLAALGGGLVLFAAPAAHAACGAAGYSYAGVASRASVSGVGATLTSLASPAVQNGHVAGWVGVGGAGLGPHGTSEWIQVGYSGFPGISVGSLYYEIALPGRAPQYHEVLSNVSAGATHRVAVLEIARHRGWWRVWVDGRRASRPYHLPGSDGWRGVATAENWGGGVRACNAFAYRFHRVVVTRQPGGSWHPLRIVYRMRQGDNHISGDSSNFVVRTTTLPKKRPAPATSAVSRTPAATPAAVAPAAPAPAADPTVTTAPPPDDPVVTAPPVDASTPDDGNAPATPGMTP